MIKKLLFLFFIAFTLAIIFFLSLPVASLFLNKKIRDFIYTHLVYKVIAAKETESVASKEEIILNLFAYANSHIFIPKNAAPGDANILDHLVTGVGWCNRQVNVFNMLLSKKGIPARYVYLKDSGGISPHTVSEVYLNNKWVIFDPQNGIYFKFRNGDYATLYQLSAHPEIIFSHPRLGEIRRQDINLYESFKTTWSRLFPLPMEPERSRPRTEKNILLIKILDTYIALFGSSFIYKYQDVYLKKFFGIT